MRAVACAAATAGYLLARYPPHRGLPWHADSSPCHSARSPGSARTPPRGAHVRDPLPARPPASPVRMLPAATRRAAAMRRAAAPVAACNTAPPGAAASTGTARAAPSVPADAARGTRSKGSGSGRVGTDAGCFDRGWRTSEMLVSADACSWPEAMLGVGNSWPRPPALLLVRLLASDICERPASLSRLKSSRRCGTVPSVVRAHCSAAWRCCRRTDDESESLRRIEPALAG